MAVQAQLSQEDELARRVQAGDDAAFDRLVELCSPRVYALAYRMMGNSEDAQDIAQEAFVRVFQALPRFRQQAAFSTWIYRIVVNLCQDELSRRRRRPTPVSEFAREDDSSGLPEFPASDDTPEDSFLRQERQQAIQQAILQLPPDFRAVVILYDVQGLSYQEIAEVLKSNLGTVKSRLNRARHQLREILSANRELLGLETSHSQ